MLVIRYIYAMHNENSDIQQYIEIAIQEALNPTFEMTRLYLENNELELVNGLPEVERIDTDLPNGLAAVYLKFREGFFLQVNLTRKPEIAVEYVWVESSNAISLTAVSEKKKFDDLAKCLSLSPLKGWSKGDKKQTGDSNYIFTSVSYESATSNAYDMEAKLKLLLTELETDTEDVLKLTQCSTAHISICRRQFVSGNSGVHFDAETINRLSKLNLSLDIDTIIVGKPITENLDD